MKLKLSFEKKDMQIFLIFAGVMLIVVSLAVVNFSSLLTTGKFGGLNVFLAFTPKHISATLGFYLIALIGLIASCKSYFFEFDKGFGIISNKKSEGYNRWADRKEMQSELKMLEASSYKSQFGGIPLINDGHKLWVDDGEYHNLVIGSTGSGKTQCIVLPLIQSLAKHDESMIITDPKGEIYEKTSIMLRKRGYNIIVLNFRNPGQGNAWNPLSLPYRLWKSGNQDKAIELLDDLALNILYDESAKNNDPFWEKTSADYFSGIALGLFEDATEEQININSISMMTTVGEEKIGGSTYIKEYYSAKDPNGAAYINASSTIMAPNDTKMSILAVFKQKIKLFASRLNLSEMLSYSDFSIEDIGLKKTALFIVIQDEKKTYHSLATILIKQIYETLIDVAQKNGGKLPIRTNFLLDEFANMPPLKDVTTMITAARSRAMRFTLIIQNFAQLNEVYGEQNAETIKGNCGNLIYLISTELKALEEISKMCGEVKSKKDDKTTSTPLITISDLQKLKMFEVIVRRLRIPPFKTKLTPDFKMNWGGVYPKTELNKIIPRERREVKTFDVREFVKTKKKEKISNILDTDMTGFGSGSPFGNSSSPFLPYDSPSRDNFINSESLMNNAPMFNDNNSTVDMDDIISKIDKQIALLEQEEKAKNALNNNKIDSVVNNSILREENNSRLNEIVNSIKDDSNEIDTNKDNSRDGISDDEFFDDFFDE